MQLTEILQIVNIILSVVVPPLAAFFLKIKRSKCCGSEIEREVDTPLEEKQTNTHDQRTSGIYSAEIPNYITTRKLSRGEPGHIERRRHSIIENPPEKTGEIEEPSSWVVLQHVQSENADNTGAVENES